MTRMLYSEGHIFLLSTFDMVHESDRWSEMTSVIAIALCRQCSHTILAKNQTEMHKLLLLSTYCFPENQN